MEDDLIQGTGASVPAAANTIDHGTCNEQGSAGASCSIIDLSSTELEVPDSGAQITNEVIATLLKNTNTMMKDLSERLKKTEGNVKMLHDQQALKGKATASKIFVPDEVRVS